MNITIMLYQQKVNDPKHNVTFNKDKVSYRHKTFDAIIAKSIRPTIEKAINDGLKYPLLLELDNETGYFLKQKKYTRNDNTEGVKYQMVIQGIVSISQGKFENKSLDDIVDELSPKSEVFDDDLESAE